MDDVTGHPAVAAAERLARDLLEPHAAEVDAGTVPRSNLDALGAAGLLGLGAPAALGGAGAPPAVLRRVAEVLAGADLSTWFVQAQHHSPLRALVASGRFDGLVPELAAGRKVAGVAFAHLRRWPRRTVTATRARGGWRLDGVAPWYTGWGLNDLAHVGAVSEAGEVVFALLDARPMPGLSASEPMRVAAVQAAATVRLTFGGLVVADERVVSVQPRQEWARADEQVAVNASPAVFGLADSALRLLRDLGEQRAEPEAVEAAERLGGEVAGCRRECYRLLDEVPAEAMLPERLALRARAHRALTEATTALVIAGAGGSMAASAPAQRKAREALFLLVQAQTGAARAAALRASGQGYVVNGVPKRPS